MGIFLEKIQIMLMIARKNMVGVSESVAEELFYHVYNVVNFGNWTLYDIYTE